MIPPINLVNKDNLSIPGLFSADEIIEQAKTINQLIAKYNKITESLTTENHIPAFEILMKIFTCQKHLVNSIAGINLYTNPALESFINQEINGTLQTHLNMELKNLNPELSIHNPNALYHYDEQNNAVMTAPQPLFPWVCETALYIEEKMTADQDKYLPLLRPLKRLLMAASNENNGKLVAALESFKTALRQTNPTSEDKVLFKQVQRINYELSLLKHSHEDEQTIPLVSALHKEKPATLNKLVQTLYDNAGKDKATSAQLLSMLPPYFNQYEITFLGGANTKNYLLTHRITHEKHVLGIGIEKGNAAVAAENLKKTSFNQFFAKVYYEQNGFKSQQDGKLLSLSVTKFYEQGDVLQYSRKTANDDERLTRAIDVYEQMFDLALHVVREHHFFPDMKPTNVLVNEAGRLIVADTKSFLHAPRGLYKPPETGNIEQVMLQTPDFSPLHDENDIYTKSFQAYIIGRGMYLFLTGKDEKDQPKHVDTYDYSDAIFQTNAGRQFQTIIEGLTNTEESERFSLFEAKQKVLNITHHENVTDATTGLRNSLRASLGKGGVANLAAQAQEALASSSASTMEPAEKTQNEIAIDTLNEKIFSLMQDDTKTPLAFAYIAERDALASNPEQVTNDRAFLRGFSDHYPEGALKSALQAVLDETNRITPQLSPALINSVMSTTRSAIEDPSLTKLGELKTLSQTCQKRTATHKLGIALTGLAIGLTAITIIAAGVFFAVPTGGTSLLGAILGIKALTLGMTASVAIASGTGLGSTLLAGASLKGTCTLFRKPEAKLGSLLSKVEEQLTPSGLQH